MPLLYHAYVYLEFLILACTIYILAPMPLMRIPEQATLCEKIGGTEYTVTAHFREDGRDLLGLLSRIFMRDTADYSFDSEGYDED